MAFSWVMSQVMVCMKAQSEPDGQQMTDWTDALLRGMQLVSLGQQKEDGKPAPHCCRLSSPPHTGACREKRVDACAVVKADAMRPKMNILDKRGCDVGEAIILKVKKTRDTDINVRRCLRVGPADLKMA